MKFTTRLIYTTYFLLSTSICLGQTYAKNGMVVSDTKIASEVGVNVLKLGGNAIDASVATAFALAVTHPAAGNIGGGGFMVYRPKTGNATTIDFREKAPLAATPTMFLDKSGLIKDRSNHQGALSIGVPGTVAGLYLAHKKYGKLPWEKLVQPAIDIALEGFPLPWALFNVKLGALSPTFKAFSKIPLARTASSPSL